MPAPASCWPTASRSRRSVTISAIAAPPRRRSIRRSTSWLCAPLASSIWEACNDHRRAHRTVPRRPSGPGNGAKERPAYADAIRPRDRQPGVGPGDAGSGRGVLARAPRAHRNVVHPIRVAERVVPLRDGARPRVQVGAAGSTPSVTATYRTLHLLARRSAAPARRQRVTLQPMQSAAVADLPDLATAALCDRATSQRGTWSELRRPGRRRSAVDDPQDEVLQVPVGTAGQPGNRCLAALQGSALLAAADA